MCDGIHASMYFVCARMCVYSTVTVCVSVLMGTYMSVSMSTFVKAHTAITVSYPAQMISAVKQHTLIPPHFSKSELRPKRVAHRLISFCSLCR